jgi:hypothetical protein
MRRVLIDQKDTLGVLQHNVGVMELSQRHTFEYRPAG